MVRATAGRAFPVVLSTFVLSICLFGDCKAARMSPIFGELIAALNECGTHWGGFACAVLYCITFFILRRGVARGGRTPASSKPSVPGELSLIGFVALASVAYAIDRTRAVIPPHPVTLVVGVALGQGAALWARQRRGADGQLTEAAGVVVAAILLLLGTAMWQTERGSVFQYRGQGRWSGPWDNPNTFGMLMGVGAALAIGVLLQGLKSKVQNVECRKFNLYPWFWRIFLLGTAIAMGIGLVKSYSRGAWLGTMVALAYLGYCVGSGTGNVERRKQKLQTNAGYPDALQEKILNVARIRWRALVIICASIGTLAFWGFRHTEWAVARRAYSLTVSGGMKVAGNRRFEVPFSSGAFSSDTSR